MKKILSKCRLLALPLLFFSAAAAAAAPGFYYRVPAVGTAGIAPWGAPAAAPTWSPVADASTAANTLILMTANGDVYTYGENDYGQLGNGAADGEAVDQYTKNAPASLTSGAVKVLEGTYQSFIIAKDGSLWFSGWNTNGQAGMGTTTNVYTFTKVPNLANVVKVASTSNANFVVESDGSLWSSGNNYYSQRGVPGAGTANSKVFVKTTLPFPPGVVAADVAAEQYSSIVLDSQGNIWVSGYNYDGTLGTGATTGTTYTSYTKVPYFTGNAIAVAATDTAVAVLTNDGVVHTAGRNNNMDTARGSPYAVNSSFAPAASGVMALSAGKAAITVSKGDGYVYASAGIQENWANSNMPGVFPWSLKPALKYGAGNAGGRFFVIQPDGSLWTARNSSPALTQSLFLAY